MPLFLGIHGAQGRVVLLLFQRGGLHKTSLEEGGGFIFYPHSFLFTRPPASKKNSIFQGAREGLLTLKNPTCAILTFVLE
jgi:hypothetical protein